MAYVQGALGGLGGGGLSDLFKRYPGSVISADTIHFQRYPQPTWDQLTQGLQQYDNQLDAIRSALNPILKDKYKKQVEGGFIRYIDELRSEIAAWIGDIGL